MGNGLELRDQPGVIQSWNVSPEWLQRTSGASSPKNLCIVTGFGDSMRPMFNPGDPLIVDRGVQAVEYDAIYFFRVGSEGFIKRLQRIPTATGRWSGPSPRTPSTTPGTSPKAWISRSSAAC